VLGDAVKGGMYGAYPALRDSDLTLGNLIYTNDFRSTYSTILALVPRRGQTDRQRQL